MAQIGAGALDQRIVIQRKISTADGIGGFTEAWFEIANVAANMTPVSSRERVEAMRQGTQTGFKAIIRWQGDEHGQPKFVGADKVIWRGREYAVYGVTPIGGRHAYLEMLLNEGAPS